MVFASQQLPSFRCFSESTFHLNHYLRQFRDGRPEAEIAASVVGSSVVFMGLLGLGSLLQCDQTLRTFLGQDWFGYAPAVSDSTMSRSLESMEFGPVRQMLHASYLLGRHEGLSKCPVRSGKLRLGLVDGSDFGHFFASALEVIGVESFFVDLEPYECQTKGKELPASYALLRRCRERFGVSFVDVMMADGLYLNQFYFNLCLNELHCDALVKSNDFTRDIAQEAVRLFTDEAILSEAIELKADEPIPAIAEGQVIRLQGFDSERLCEYHILMAGGFQLEGVEEPLQVAWVREKPVYPSQRKKLAQDKKKSRKKGSGFCEEGESEFLAVATGRYLSRPLDAREMRQLGHWRWDEENDGFKAANQRVRTKRLYSKNPNAKLVILMILLTTFNLLSVYLHRYGSKLTNFPGMKQTKLFQQQMLRYLTIVAAWNATADQQILEDFQHR